MQAINDKLIKASNDVHFKPIGVFVTFEKDDDYELALEWADYRQRKRRNDAGKSRLSKEEYDELVGKFDHFVYPEFEGQRVDLKQAPEPEVVMWAHLEYHGWQQLWRRWVVNVAAVFILVSGITIIVGANYKKGGMEFLTSCDSIAQDLFEKSSAAGTGVTISPGGTAYCDGLPLDAAWPSGGNASLSVQAAEHYKAAWLQTERELQRHNPVKFPVIRASGGSGTCRLAEPGSCCEQDNFTWAQAREAGCLRADTGTSVVSKGGSRDAICYACVCSAAGMYSNLLAASGGQTAYCAEYMTSWITTMAWTLVAVCIVAAVNGLAKVVMEEIVDFEQNDTTGGEQGSLAFKIFIAQFIFTGLCVVFVRLNFSVTDSIPVERFDQASARFYAKVLAPLIITMVSVFLAPPMAQVAEFVAFKVLKKVLAKLAHTQNGLNQVHEDGHLKVGGTAPPTPPPYARVAQ